MNTIQLITSIVLAFATVGLMVATIVLARATSKYQKATERLADLQEKALDVDESSMILAKYNLMSDWYQLHHGSGWEPAEKIRERVHHFIVSHLVDGVKADNLPEILTRKH